jgi:hypothetical protein
LRPTPSRRETSLLDLQEYGKRRKRGKERDSVEEENRVRTKSRVERGGDGWIISR